MNELRSHDQPWTITKAEASLLVVPRDTVIRDAIHTITQQELVLVHLETEQGVSGRGFAFTIGSGGGAVLSLLSSDLLDVLIGQDARMVEALWSKSYRATHWTSVGAITSLAIGAIDIALWDLRGKYLGLPLWLLCGGARDRVPVYDTEVGFIHLDRDELVRSAEVAVDAGWRAMKIKIGRPSALEDYERVAAVRDLIGPDIDLMVDANQTLTISEALRRARLFEPLNLLWFEEPLPAADITGHRQLAQSTAIPIAVGESLYSVHQFHEYLSQQAAHVLQPDAAKLGGITPFLKVAHLAEAANVTLAPHLMMELHVSLAAAVQGTLYIEHFPLLDKVTSTPTVRIDRGWAIPPEGLGTGIAWDEDALRRFRKGETSSSSAHRN